MKRIISIAGVMLFVLFASRMALAWPDVDIPSYDPPDFTTTIQSYVLSADMNDYKAAASDTKTFIYGEAPKASVKAPINWSGKPWIPSCINYEKNISLRSKFFSAPADEKADVECESLSNDGSSCKFKCSVDSSWVEKATAASNAHGVASAILEFEAVIPMGEGQTSHKMFGLDPIMAEDGDSDGAPDDLDNCPSVANTDQADKDHDGKGDKCASILIQMPIGKKYVLDPSKLKVLPGDDASTTDPAATPDPAVTDGSDDDLTEESSGDLPSGSDEGSLKFSDNGAGCSMIPASQAGSLSWLLAALALVPMGFRRKKK